MRLAALIIGIFGGMAGFLGALFALAVGGLGSELGVEESGTVVTLGLIALAMSIVAIIGAALCMAKPRLAASLMILSTIVGVISIFVFYSVAAIFLIIAAILAFIARKERPKAT